jgi:uncharacterized protein
MRLFHKFSYKDADYRITAANFKSVTKSIIKHREILEEFILTNQNFLNSLIPIPDLPEYAPQIAKLMQKAGNLTNVGPMAAVAGSIAQSSVEETFVGDFNRKRGDLNVSETIIENGGDIFMILEKELVLGIFCDTDALRGRLAFRIQPEDTPLAVCSSSGTMGHSLSLGCCNLTTVFSKSGALADAAATRACNLVKSESDIEGTLNEISAIPGILGLLIIKGDKVGMAGDLPEIISNADPDIINKITHHRQSNPLDTIAR